LLFAGWVGIFITALNLIPIGQLDGGHILYTLLGRRAHTVAVSVLAFAVGYMIFTGNYSYSLMVILMLMMGPRHPPTADDSVPLGTFRIVLGWLTLGFILIGFTPTPIM
jgi:membrane-associated protease RseP (regulator of RpoE activity)